MNLYQENLAKHRRISILILLADSGAANESLLLDCLEGIGLEAELTREAVRADLRFLEERGLVVLSWPNDNLAVAHVTQRGIECAKGRIMVDGVKKPSLAVR